MGRSKDVMTWQFSPEGPPVGLRDGPLMAPALIARSPSSCMDPCHSSEWFRGRSLPGSGDLFSYVGVTYHP